MYTPEGRHPCAGRAGPTSGTRGSHAGYPLYVRRRTPSARRAHAERTSSVLLTHIQRTCNAYGRAVRWLFAERALHARCMHGPFVPRASNTLYIRWIV